MSKRRILTLDVKPNEYDVLDHIGTKIKANSCMISTLNNEKYI